jgi:hypothetical protein
VGIGTGAVGSYIVARKAAVCVTVRQATIAEQSLPEQETPRVLVARGRNRHNRLLTAAGLTGWRLRDRRRGRVEANDSQQEVHNTAPAYRRNCQQRLRRGSVK